ncbi:MAG: TrmH family RNA methyltransferase [Acidimicrobiia bacterium]
MTALVPIDDPADPRVAVYIGLRDHQLRMDRERSDPTLRPLFIAEGERLIGEALAAGLTPVSMLRSADHPTLVEASLPEGTPVFGVGPKVAVAITGLHIHRGALACFLRPPERSAPQVVSGSQTLVVAERVTNPTNLGVMARSAAGLGVGGLLLDEPSCDPLYRRALRVAMGASFTLPWARVPSIPAAMGTLREAGFTTVAMAITSESAHLADLGGLALSGRTALVVGNEFHGLSDEVLEAADIVATIPMTGGVDSLNVAAAAAVACWEIMRSR